MGWMHSLRSSSLRWFLFPLLVGRSLFSQTLLSPKKASNDPKIPNFFARLSLLLHFRTFSILKNMSGREVRQAAWYSKTLPTFSDTPTRCATRSTLVKQATSGTKTVRTSVYFCVGMLVFQTRPVKGAESYVAEIRDLLILAMFVLPQAEGPGRAVAGRTSRCLHLQHLCRLLSTGHAERAREAASSPSLLNVA